MKKLLMYVIVSVMIGTGIISCNTDIEALDIVVPDNMSEEYWDNLRAYKARNDHEVFFGWFGGWTANSADMINFLSSVPDSVDIISIWGDYKNLSPAQIEDLRYVQDVKGTRVTYTIFAHKIPDEFMSGENHEIATSEGIEEYAKALVDTMYKYGYQGIDLDYEPGYQEFPGEVTIRTRYPEDFRTKFFQLDRTRRVSLQTIVGRLYHARQIRYGNQPPEKHEHGLV